MIEIFKRFNLKSILREPKWWLTIQLPFLLICVFELLYKKPYKNRYYNSRIYDGFTRNDFYKGSLMQFLFRLNIIKQAESYNSDNYPDFRSYFIGYRDDD